MYLRDRQPIVLNYNPFISYVDDPKTAYNDQVIRAANFLISAIRCFFYLSNGLFTSSTYLIICLAYCCIGSGKPWMLVYLNLKFITWTQKRATLIRSAKLFACCHPRCRGTAPTFTKWVCSICLVYCIPHWLISWSPFLFRLFHWICLSIPACSTQLEFQKLAKIASLVSRKQNMFW